jgi:nucleotide-binding universal stress UspA family protein
MYEYREFTMKTIVVATDFAGTSYGAINHAKQLAICFSAKIPLVHVVDSKPSALPAKQVAPSVAELIDSAEEELEKIYTNETGRPLDRAYPQSLHGAKSAHTMKDFIFWRMPAGPVSP